MKAPLVSVLMSVHNGGSRLAESLDSVLSQRGVDFEVVTVDDGSTDRTSELLAEVARRDGRLRVFAQDKQGLTRALNRAAAEAKGVLLARHDVDDLSLPGRLERGARVLLARKEVVVSSSWVSLIGPEDEALDITRFPEDDEAVTRAVLEDGRNLVHGASMFRREDFERAGGYRTEFYFAQDADLWCRMGELGQFHCVPEPLYALRISEGSLTSRFRSAQTKLHRIARELRIARREGRSEAPLLAEAARLRPGVLVSEAGDVSAGSWFLARALIRNRDPRARRYARTFVRQRPWNPKGWVSLLQAAMIRW